MSGDSLSSKEESVPKNQDEAHMLSSQVERRLTIRKPLRLGVSFSSADELAQAVMAFTMNIGLGGLCLLTSKAYQVGARLELTIQLGNDESLQVGAVVAWTRPGKAIGVRFDSLDEKQNARLTELLGSAQQNLRKTIR